MNRTILYSAVVTMGALFVVPFVDAQAPVRIATYNIKFLDTEISERRAGNLRDVIADLEAQVIGLQEIDDRAALEQIFRPADWVIIIDDDSGNDQDVAMVVALDSNLDVRGFDGDFDADDENFLFPDSDDNSAFPRRRDALFVELRPAGASESFFVIVQHTKARYGGRFSTTPRRVENSRMLLLVLEERFQDDDYIVLGDFNDSPDDQALNILEEGDPGASMVMENQQGAFLINLVEPLWAQGLCSWGHNTTAIGTSGDTINLADAEARAANFHERNSDDNNYHRRNLLDNILIPHRMVEHLLTGSAAIYDGPAGVRNGSRDRASDHLPVYADFTFDVPTSPIRIALALPNPIGRDAGNETVTLENTSQNSVALTGWCLKDRAGHRFELTGSIGPTARRVITLPAGKVPLNQTGDTIFLYDDDDAIQDRVSYDADEVTSGVEVSFE